MSAPRLTFLYPHLFKPLTLRESTLTYRPFRRPKSQPRKSKFSSTARRRVETYAQRYGPAAEPQLPPPDQPPVPNDLRRDQSLAGAIEKEVKGPVPKPEEAKKTEQAPPKEPSAPKEERAPAAKPATGDKPAKLDASEVHPREPILPSTTTTTPTPQQEPSSAQPLAKVLNRSEPGTATASEHKPPHLQAPRYIHHFDTFTLVRDLQKGGFTQEQSVTLMKALRGLLAQNLDVAHDGLVSKSDMENETYLFRAACSELRTEILNARRLSARKTSTQLSHLQHETSLLSQRLTQESSALKDDLRGMLNDRRMAVRMEQQAMDQAIQELNYKITVALMSGSKSEVEGLRWVLTRRAAMAIAGMALLILGSLRYTTYKIHLREQDKRLAAEKVRAEAGSQSSGGAGAGGGGGGGGSGNFTVPSREMSTQTGADTEAMLANVSKDGSPAYVSLG
ncbi:MAG: hypothetical protein L6R39_007453 [Caloplaca ligustica]|nr:MAG: hypothetical protein L6R39_007453 [Caloplaca ligustica]